MVQAVKMPWRYKDNVTALYLEHRKVYLGNPTAFFDVYNFRSVLPVKIYGWEILGNGTGVHIVGKQDRCVLLGFVIAFGNRMVKLVFFFHDNSLKNFLDNSIVQ